MTKGKFIVLEGIEGAGKTTLCKVVAEELRKRDLGDPLLLREPGGTELGEQLRKLIKDSQALEPLHDMAELLLLYAARVQLVEQVIKPALGKGIWVVGDRHDLSTQAYQGGGRWIEREILSTLRTTILGKFSPDLTLCIDVPAAQAFGRLAGRGTELDRIEQEDLAFFERVRQRYLELAAEDARIVLIDGSRQLPEVHYAVQQVISGWLSKTLMR